MNSLYNPVDSIKSVLHSSIMRNGTQLVGTCLDCGDTVSFNTNLRRWSSDESGSIRCSA